MSSSSDRRPGTESEAGSGWVSAHREDGERRRMPLTPTSSLPQLSWWHTARYTQIFARLGQTSQNGSLLQQKDDLKTSYLI